MRLARFDEPKESARADRDDLELREQPPGATFRIALEHRNTEALAHHGGAVHFIQAEELSGLQE